MVECVNLHWRTVSRSSSVSINCKDVLALRYKQGRTSRAKQSGWPSVEDLDLDSIPHIFVPRYLPPESHKSPHWTYPFLVVLKLALSVRTACWDVTILAGEKWTFFVRNISALGRLQMSTTIKAILQEKVRSRENIHDKVYWCCLRCKELPKLVNKAYSFSNISTERPVNLVLLPAERVTAERACTKLQHNETRSWSEFMNVIKSSGQPKLPKAVLGEPKCPTPSSGSSESSSSSNSAQSTPKDMTGRKNTPKKRTSESKSVLDDEIFDEEDSDSVFGLPLW